MKNEFQVIADLIEKDKKVLDVGCADGTLMKFLKDNKNINIRGLEISKEKNNTCFLCKIYLFTFYMFFFKKNIIINL